MMEVHMKTFRVLHICDYAALYRGNFIDSLESLQVYHDNVENFYLFPFRAKGTAAQEWIEDLNNDHKRAHLQESSFIQNFILLSQILKNHKINRIVRHFSDAKIDILIKLLFKGKHVVRFLVCFNRFTGLCYDDAIAFAISIEKNSFAPGKGVFIHYWPLIEPLGILCFLLP